MSSLVATLVLSRSLLIKGKVPLGGSKNKTSPGCRQLFASDWSSLCDRVRISGLVSYRPVLVRWAHLTVGSIATELEELKFLIRPGTGSRAHGQRRSESLNSVGLSGRPKVGVVPTGPGRREVNLKTGVAQRWGRRPSLSYRWLSSESLPGQCWTFALAARVAPRGACPPVIRIQPERP